MQRKLVLASGVALLAAALLAAGGWQWWRSRAAHVPPIPVATAPPVEAPAAASAPRPEATIRHPIESMPSLPAEPVAAAPGAGGDAVKSALEELLGTRAVLTHLLVDDFIGRVVATVDNLDREHASPRLWPVLPTPGRFTVTRGASGEVIAADNAARYTPFVRFVEGIDTQRAVALYVRFYPQFQQAYAGLGYPRRYFNDRVVEVIDALIATPVPANPPAVRLLEVKGPVPAAQPWTRYEYADPALEALKPGQKIMLRIGPDNASRLRAKLAEFRRGIARAP